MMDFGFTSSRGMRTTFEAQYNCSSTAMAGKDVDDGDKIFLPPSALDKLARMNVEYPMLFELSSCGNGVDKKTHCGVLEFSAEEGWCYMPFWMMQNLLMDEGSLIKVKNVSLPKATFVKFRAQSVDFLEVSNPRALLEVALRKYTCLTLGDTICIPYDKNKKFYLDVMEVQPNGAASIIETDCNVDFDEPLGYKDSKYAQYEKNKEGSTGNNSVDSSVNGKAEKKVIDRPLQKATIVSEEDSNTNKFQAFSGAAKRIDGKVSGKAEAKDSFSSGSSAKAGADTGSSAKASSAKADSAEISKEIPAAPVHQSRIGSKFSKKKAAVSAFGGPAHKLNG